MSQRLTLVCQARCDHTFDVFLRQNKISLSAILKLAFSPPNSEPQADLLEIYKAGGGGGGKAS